MAESHKNPDNDLFNTRSTPSNEHTVFAETLRDWRDPLLQGHERIQVPLCPKCAVCKCQLLKNVPNTSSNSMHHHKHDPSCSNFRHRHERAKTQNQQRNIREPKRRAFSHDSSITTLNTSSSSSSIIKSSSFEPSCLSPLSKITRSPSKIPIRVSKSLSQSSSASSLANKCHSSNKKTKIPRLIINHHQLLSTIEITDQLYEKDSLNDDSDHTSQNPFNNENKKKKNMKTINQSNNSNGQVLIKSKKKKSKNTIPISDKRHRRHRHKEGRHSKSKSTSNDLSASSSLSSSSQSLVQLRRKSQPSNTQRSTTSQVPLSSPLLSNGSEIISSRTNPQFRPLSEFIPTDQSHITSSLSSSKSSSSIYLIQLTNQDEQTNSFGLTKTIPFVWKNSNTNLDNDEAKNYPDCSIEQIPPIFTNLKTSKKSRSIVLQRGQVDSWQNVECSPDSIITSSCQDSIGSASDLLLSSSLIQQQSKTPQDSLGNIISITTTVKPLQSSLLNKTKPVQQRDGKQFRYSKSKSRSDNQLNKYNRSRKKYQKGYKTDSYTDSGSSSEPNNELSVSFGQEEEDNQSNSDKTHEVLKESPMNVCSQHIDSIEVEHPLSRSDLNNTSLSLIPNDKTSDSLSAPSPKPVQISKSKQISYASTDEDVDELNSRCFEDIDRSLMIIEDYREKLNTRIASSINDQSPNQTNSSFRSRILSTEYSQITIDSGVDITSEQKICQLNATLIIDESSSEQITDRNDVFNLSDDSLMEQNSLLLNPLLNQSINEQSDLSLSTSKTEQDSTFFTAKSDLTDTNQLYSAYELEVISDEEDDYPVKDETNELLITTESTRPRADQTPSIPSIFEFKLPSFGEWIDRAFTSFLSDTASNSHNSMGSSRSSSISSIHTSNATTNTSSSSYPITVLNTNYLHNASHDGNINMQQVEILSNKEEDDDEEHSLNDMSSSSLNNEKIDFDTYMINSNYERINSPITYEQNETPLINERSKSLLSSITSSIANDDQEVMNNRRMPTYDDEQNLHNINDENDFKQLTTTTTTTNTNDISSYSCHEKFQYASNSHDSLNQSDNNIDTAASSIDDLTKANQFLTSTFHSKDSALGLSDDNLNFTQSNELTVFEHDNKQHHTSSLVTSQDIVIDNMVIETNTSSDSNCEIMQKTDSITFINDPLPLNEYERTNERTLSTSSSEQLIPREKQTGMYYKAFGSAAAIHLTEQYNCQWLKDNMPTTTTPPPPPSESDYNNYVRIVDQGQIIGDNEDEFYFSPQTLQSYNSCPNLTPKSSKVLIRERSYSLSTLDAYVHLNITHETLEQIWHSLLNVAFSDKDDPELNDYKLRHIIGLSNSYSNINSSLIEKSRSHNDIFTITSKNNQKSIAKAKSKSFDVTTLVKQTSASSSIHNSSNLGLLQGADISEPFADRIISVSIQSDLESIQSFEPEQISNEVSLQSPNLKEPLNFVFNFSNQLDNEEFDLEQVTEMDDKPISLFVTYEDTDEEEDAPPIIQIHDLYTELALFRPHSLSTIPSSRASQYASSVDSDDIFEHQCPFNTKDLNIENFDDNYQSHISDDDHGVIGSDFSSPQSRPLSSIHSQPLSSPEQNQVLDSVNFTNIDHDAWERCIDEPIFYDDLCLNYKNEEESMEFNEYANNLSTIIPIDTSELTENLITDKIESISLTNEFTKEYVDSNNFIQKLDSTVNSQAVEQDYLTVELQLNHYLDPNELVQRLEQLDSPSNNFTDQQDINTTIDLVDNSEQNINVDIENLTSILNEIRQANHMKKVSTKKLILQEPINVEKSQSLVLTKPATTLSKPFQSQRLDKVSDLEIVKQGKGFKIGYIDRQGTDQRVILTKRIEAASDLVQRGSHTRLASNERRILNQSFSSVLYTNGDNRLQEDTSFERSTNGIEVPSIGTNPKHFDESDMISIDIDGPSTMLNSICESIVITQGSVYTNNSSKQPSDNSNTEKKTDSSYTISNQYEEYLIQTSHHLRNDKIEVLDSWHDHTVINGSSTAWRSPFKPLKYIPPSSTNSNQTITSSTTPTSLKPIDSSKQQRTTRDVLSSPIPSHTEKQYQTIGTSPITVRQTVDRACQYSPTMTNEQGLQCSLESKTIFTQVSSYEIPGLLKTQDGIQTTDNSNYRAIPVNATTLERSADSGILVDDNHRRKSNFALQVDMKSSSSDSEDISELTTRPIVRPTPITNRRVLYENPTPIMNTNLRTATANEIEQEILQLRRERSHILDLLSLNWSRSNIWVELTEAKLNYIIGETDALLRSLSYDSTSIDNETVKLKMQQYEHEMAELTRQHLAVYRERLEDSKKQLDLKIDELESRKSSYETIHSINHITNFEYTPRSIQPNHNTKRLKSFLSTSAENLTFTPIQDTIADHPELLDVSFLTSTPLKVSNHQESNMNNNNNNNTNETVRTMYYRTTAPISTTHQYDCSTRLDSETNGNLSKMEGLSKSQQAILDETDKLVKDSQQLHTESASQFERARESLLSSETSIRLARANMAASRLSPYSEKKTYVPNNVTLAELFKYEQSLTKEAAKNSRHLYSNTKASTES